MDHTVTTAVRARPLAVPRLWARDGVFVLLSVAHAGALLLVPSTALIAIGLWWSANTIAHNFIHRPFRSRRQRRTRLSEPGARVAATVVAGAAPGAPR
jgi:fatty acid desaturase